jgi:hypothetical protein
VSIEPLAEHISAEKHLLVKEKQLGYGNRDDPQRRAVVERLLAPPIMQRVNLEGQGQSDRHSEVDNHCPQRLFSAYSQCAFSL